MKYLRRIIILLVLLLVAMQLSCTGHEAGNDRSMESTSQIREGLLAQDYRGILEHNGFITLSEAKAATGENAYLRIYAENADQRIGCNEPGHTLSNKECGMMIGWRMPNAVIVTTQTNLMLGLGRYIREKGVVPISGPDIYPELLTNEGYANFCNLSPQQQIIRYNCIINPITGKFYDSFCNPEWVYGGLNVEMVNGREEIARRFKEYSKTKVIVDMETGESVLCNRLIVTTFYGEAPGLILYKWIEPQAI
jgi:hypothetical protein